MLRETHQDFVVRSSDFRMEKSAWECPTWIVVLHLRYNKKKRKNWLSVCRNKNLKVKWKLSWRQEAVSLWMMRVLKITNFQFFLSTLAFLSSSSMKLKGTKIRKNGKRKDVDFVDEYVLVLYSNRIFIPHFLLWIVQSVIRSVSCL